MKLGKSRYRFCVVGAIILCPFILSAAQAASCKQYSNCAEAVENWSAGNHSRADGDKDGIPCENVCRTNHQVDKIKKKIDCTK